MLLRMLVSFLDSADCGFGSKLLRFLFLVKHTTAGGIMVEWGELCDAEDEVVDALENRSDSIRIAISM